MRESVKKNKKWTAIAVAIAIVMLLSLTIGLLVSSIGGNTDGPIDSVSGVADLSWSGSQVGNTNTPTSSGTAIGNATTLMNFLRTATAGQVGYLTASFEFKWDTSTSLSNANFKGILDGNGNTLTLTNDLQSWSETGVDDTSENDGTVASGLFVAINNGTIKNIKFNFKGIVRANMSLCGKGGAKIWAGGIVCGANNGTIDNVSLSTTGYVDGNGQTQRSYVGFHYAAGAAANAQQKVIVGGICGKQNGTLTRAYADYKNIQIEADAKNSNHTGILGSNPSLHMATVGGIYGAYTTQDKAKQTKNLMLKGDGATVFQVANNFTGSNPNKYLYKTIGAVAGVSLRNVEGVVWDYRGTFTINDFTGTNNDGQHIDSSYSGELCAAAYSGIPTGFYSPFSKYPILNGATQAKNYEGNIFSKANKYLPTTDNYPHYERTGLGDVDTSKKILTDDYDAARLGAIDLYFTTTANELCITKTLDAPSANNDITAYDVFWRTGLVGASTDDTNYTMDNNKTFKNTISLVEDTAYEIISGKRFGKLKLVSGQQTYTGQDFIQLYAQEALSDYRRDLSEHLGLADLTLDRTKCKFLIEGNDNQRLTSLIYPQVVGNVTIKTTQSGDRYQNFSYVDLDKRFVCEITELTSVAMLPGDLTSRTNQPYEPVTYNKSWSKTKEVTLRILPSATMASNTVVITDGSNGAVIDRIDYRRVGTENYTTVSNVKYINSGGNHYGAKFTIDETTPTEGAAYEIIAYHNGTAVAFDYHKTGNNAGTMSGPFNLGVMKIDGIDPTIDLANVAYLSERWYNQNQTGVTVTVEDANSGIDSSGVKLYKKACTGTTFSDSWEFVTNTNYSFDGKNITLSFTEHAKYRFVINDQAGNTITSAEFEVKVDTAKPVINNVSYYYLNDQNVRTNYDYARDGRISQTIFAEVSVTLGHSGGMLSFYAKDDEDGNNSTADNVVQHTADGVFVAAIQKAGNPKVDNPEEFDPVNYVFYVTSVARDNDGENPIVSDLKEDTAQVSVGQIVLNITIDKLDISSLTKVYDGSANFTGTINVLGTYPLLGENANNINNLVNISGRFIRSYEGTGTYWEDVKDASTSLVLIIEMYAKTGYNFAISNNQAQNNIYPFMVGLEDVTYTVNGKQVTNVQEIGIFKKEIKTLKVQDCVKTYWQDNPKFEVTVGAGDLVAGDTIDDLDIDFITEAKKETNAGMQKVYARISDNCTNYYFNRNNELSTAGNLRIMRYEVKSVIFEGELNSITCFEVPNVRAYFMDAANNRKYLEIAYKNQDREEIEFIPGKRAPLGKYFYIVIMDSETATNYAIVGDPNMLIGHFEVVGDTVKEDVNYFIRGLVKDDKGNNTNIVEVEFANRIIDFRSLIYCPDNALSAKLKIYYTANEVETSTINEIGDTYVTIKILRGDNRYKAFTKEYIVRVVKANVAATNEDLIAPTEKVEAGQEKVDGVYFSNKVVNLTADNISESLYNRLDSYLTDEERNSGGVNAHYTFKYSYFIGAKAVDASKVIDKADYIVNLEISSKKVNTIKLQTTLRILTRQLPVVFDFDKFQGTGIEYDKNEKTIKKVFSGLSAEDTIVLSLDSAFEAELRALFGVTDATAEENIPYAFSRNNFAAAMEATEITFGYKFGKRSENVEFIDNALTVEIAQKIIALSLDSNINQVYSGKNEISLSDADIEELIKNGVEDPFSEGLDGLAFIFDDESGIQVIRDRENNKISLSFPGFGTYRVSIRMATANNNFRIGNGVITVTITKAPVSNISWNASYYQNGKFVEEVLEVGKTISVEYSGNKIAVNLSEEGQKELEALSVTNDQIEIIVYKKNGYRYDVIDANDFRKAGTYRVGISINNANIETEAFNADFEITKRKLGEYVGMFNPDVWYIDGNRPTLEEEENGMMYTREVDENGKIKHEAKFSMRLADEAELLAAGFEIVYKYNGVICDGVVDAGNHTVTAEISYPADADNWEVKVVQLWKLDANGKFEYTNNTQSKDPAGNEYGPNDNLVINRGKTVLTMNVLKADLQIDIDALGAQALLDNGSFEYDGTPHSIDFRKDQYELFAKNLLRVDLSKNEYIDANEYTVVATFYKLLDDGMTKDPNYDPTEMEASLIINPRKVKVFFEFDSENYSADKNGVVVYREKDRIVVNAYYEDLMGRKIVIKSFVVESVKGEGDEAEFNTVKMDEIEPGKRYQITANIADTNYTFDEELSENFFNFRVTNVTKTTNTALYILLAIFIVLLVSAGLVVLYMKRMYNPAVQVVDIDD